MKGVFKVIQQGEAQAVTSKKSENGQTMKSILVLQDLGGMYEDEFVCSMLGNQALMHFYPDDVVAVSLRFTKSEYEGKLRQDVLVREVVKIN